MKYIYDYLASEVFDRQPECLLVVTPELAAVRNAGQFLQLLRELDYDTQKVRVVLNRWESHSAVNPAVIERNLSLPVSASIPEDAAVMQAAAARGTPVLQGNAKSASARALLDLVCDLQGKSEATPRRRVFGLMRHEAKWAVS
jgi:pilus assembly protein CpaE